MTANIFINEVDTEFVPPIFDGKFKQWDDVFEGPNADNILKKIHSVTRSFPKSWNKGTLRANISDYTMMAYSQCIENFIPNYDGGDHDATWEKLISTKVGASMFNLSQNVPKKVIIVNLNSSSEVYRDSDKLKSYLRNKKCELLLYHEYAPARTTCGILLWQDAIPYMRLEKKGQQIVAKIPTSVFIEKGRYKTIYIPIPKDLQEQQLQNAKIFNDYQYEYVKTVINKNDAK